MDNQQVILPETELSYLCAFIDGEGCVGIYVRDRSKENRNNAAYSIKPVVTVTNTEKQLIDEIAKIYDALNIPYYVQHRASTGRNGESWTLVISGLKRVQKILPVLIKYCRGKKKLNALDLKEYIESRLDDWASAPFTKRQLELVENIYQRNNGKRRLNLRDYTRSSRSTKFPQKLSREDIVQTTTE